MRRPMSLDFIPKELRPWVGLAAGIVAVFTFSRLPAGGWDEAFYIAQLTSAAGDRDFVLQDDLLAFPNTLEAKFRLLTVVTPQGALQNTFSVGPPLVHAAYTWPVLRTNTDTSA